MKAQIVKPGSRHVGESCVLCGRTIKARQSILVDTVAEIRFGSGRTRRYHTKCMRDLVDKAPVGVDEFNELRDQMLATGDVFV